MMADIQLDIMDYIRPAECKSEEFREMWEEFEWENKVVINTNITDLREFLNHVVVNTHMTCLTPIEDSFTVLLVNLSSFISSQLLCISRIWLVRISWRRICTLVQCSEKTLL